MKSFIDSHMHFLGIGLNALEYVDLSSAKSIVMIKEILEEHKTREIIIARGWHQNNLLENRYPTKKDIDEVIKDVPVILIRACGHVLIANDKAMTMANVSSDTKINGGTINYSAGEFTENALELIYKIIPKATKERIKQYFIEANKILLSNGITSIGSDDFSTINIDYEIIMEALEELYDKNMLQVRLLEQVNLPSKAKLLDFIDKGYNNKKYKGFKLGPLKLLADGSLGGRTAYLDEPYTDDITNKGIKVFTQKELNELVHIADSSNMDVAIHAIGDGTINMVIEAIESSINLTKRTNHRHSIIHAQLATKSQIKRMNKLKITAQVQPIFLNSDIPIIEKRIGQRYKESYLFQTMDKLGVNTVFGTDTPVEPVNPFYNLYSAITRKSIKYPDLPPFLKEEAFTIDDALKCYTKTGYYLSYDENANFDDYILISKDIYECPIEEIKDIEVLETYIDGELVYKKM